MSKYKAFFPWFGGKGQVADFIWDRIPSHKVYVEPFAGSLAVMLASPDWESKIEVVNDLDGMVTNAWRSIKFDPEATKSYSDWPISELDLHARSTYCEAHRDDLEAKLRADPEFYDPKIAGWWMWGMSTSIGDGFIAQKKSIPKLKAGGVHRQSFNWDTHFEEMCDRLRQVRIICGDWKRVVKPSVTKTMGTPTFAFLDPPYSREERHDTYAHDSYTVAAEVEEWCKENEDDPDLMIVLAGYAGDYTLLDTWDEIEWKAQGGYSAYGQESRGKENASLERLWFSPSCKKKNTVLDLFEPSKKD